MRRSENVVLHWTQTAYECYKRGCNCWMCPTQDLISEKCQMKTAVKDLIKTRGLPNNLMGMFLTEE